MRKVKREQKASIHRGWRAIARVEQANLSVLDAIDGDLEADLPNPKGLMIRAPAGSRPQRWCRSVEQSRPHARCQIVK